MNLTRLKWLAILAPIGMIGILEYARYALDPVLQSWQGRLLMNGQWASSQPRLMFSDSNDGVSGWTDGKIPSVDAFQFPEPNWFLRADDDIVMLFRTKTENDWLYASTSSAVPRARKSG